jgi:hypothetical protein
VGSLYLAQHRAGLAVPATMTLAQSSKQDRAGDLKLNQAAQVLLGWGLACYLLIFEMGAYSVSQSGLEPMIFLPLPPRFWDYRWVVPPNQAQQLL